MRRALRPEILAAGFVTLLLLATGGAGPLGHGPPARPSPRGPAAATAGPGTGSASDLAGGTEHSRPATTTGTLADSLLVQRITAAHVPLRYAFLPALGRPHIPYGGVALTYPFGPAPLGVADLGVANRSGSLAASAVSAVGLRGIFAPRGLSGIAPDTSALDYYGVQLNGVVENVSLFGNSTYDFWTQDVAEYSTFAHQLSFLDNLWNFSSPAGALSQNALYAHAAGGVQVGTTFYYDLGPSVTVGYPFTLTLSLESGRLAGRSAVWFNYSVSNATLNRAGSFDALVFNSTGGPPAPLPSYVASNARPAPIGLPADFEMVVGGPGGGSNFDALVGSAAVDLYERSLPGAAYHVAPAAYDVGEDTGETTAGLGSTWGPGADATLGGTGGPAAQLSVGPSRLEGEWNVSNASAGADVLHFRLSPGTGFAFVAPGNGANGSAYSWAPPAPTYLLPPGTYHLWALASHRLPSESSATLGTTATWLNVSLAVSAATGVYTPLWATGDLALANVSTGCATGTCQLWNDEPGPLGNAPGGPFPWFGTTNDFLYPEFPGVYLANVSNATLTAPPAWTVATPPWELPASARLGVPTTNELGYLLVNVTGVALRGAAGIGGWWFAGAYGGPSAGAASVVLWNSSGNVLSGDAFDTGAEAVFVYGGTNNTFANNTFTASVPIAANPYSVAAVAAGSSGLFDADYGNGRLGASGCRCGDLIDNNVFDTYLTGASPVLDPYTGGTPRVPFDEAWNVTPRAGQNILGGPTLGGNFWWDYGASTNPYWALPYNASGAIALGGDAHPLLPAPLVNLTFVERGLPNGTAWRVGVDTATGVATQTTSGAELNESWPSGYYFVTAGSTNGTYGLANTQLVRVGAVATTVILDFLRVYAVTFASTGGPPGAFWALSVSNATYGSWIDLGNVATFPPLILAEGWYNYTVSPPGGYSATPASGNVDVDQNLTVSIAFSTAGTGWLNGTLRPAAGAHLEVDGQPVPLGPSGSFSDRLEAGLYSVSASAPGYLPYFNNVTVSGGRPTNLSIALVANSTPPVPGHSPGSPSDLLEWEVATGVAAAVATALAVALGLTRRKKPPTAV